MGQPSYTNQQQEHYSHIRNSSFAISNSSTILLS